RYAPASSEAGGATGPKGNGAESEESTFEPSHLFTFEPTVFTFVPAPT
ncbi:MAG: hypothetical protein ACI9VS_002463, partial [Candidatus Binatia bacterium]